MLRRSDVKNKFLIPFLILGLMVPLILSMSSLSWAGEDDVAEITDIKGSVALKRHFKTIAVDRGTRLRPKDTLKTGPDGSIGIIFKDHSTLALGPDSKLIIKEIVFEPHQSEFSFVVKLLRGTAAYVSGLIAKLSPESARFITPSASIGIRGTKFVIQVEKL